MKTFIKCFLSVKCILQVQLNKNIIVIIHYKLYKLYIHLLFKVSLKNYNIKVWNTMETTRDLQLLCYKIRLGLQR